MNQISVEQMRISLTSIILCQMADLIHRYMESDYKDALDAHPQTISMQDCRISSPLALEILQFCTKPSICSLEFMSGK